MQNLIPFQFEDRPARVLVDDDGNPWWVAADVCDLLGHSNPSVALRQLEDDDKGLKAIDTKGGSQRAAVVNEPGLYTLILNSRLPLARKFQRWVTHDVLPEIRKTGGYRLPQTLPEALRLAADQAERISQLQVSLDTARPKVEFYERVRVAEGSHTVSEAAKMLGTGEHRLFAWLRGQGLLMGSNKPYQEYVERGWFRVIEKPFERGGRPQLYSQTVLTGKGLQAIARMLGKPTQLDMEVDE